MRYLVIAQKYDEDAKEVRNYIAGEFDDYVNADIFVMAYEKRYNTYKVRIMDVDREIN